MSDRSRVLLIESMSLPPVEVLRLFAKYESVHIEIHEHYQKRSFRNRYDILTANGPQRLSIPLRKGKTNRVMKDVLISYDDHWHIKHLTSIRSAYGKAPFFKHYFEELSDIISKKHEHLLDLNSALLEFVLKQIDLSPTILYTEDYIESNELDIQIKDYRHTFLPNNISSHRAMSYPQVFEDRFGFSKSLSCLDLLFCVGPAASSYLH